MPESATAKIPHVHPLKAAKFFLLRTPAFSNAVLAQLRKEFDEGKAVARSGLLASPFVQEALYLASPNLHARLKQNGIEGDTRLGMSVARYLYRMASRPTPFGLFAGITTGKIGDSLSLQVCESEMADRVCRLDQTVISQLQSKLYSGAQSLDVLKQTALVLNSSLWKAPDGFRYAEAATGDESGYKLSRVAASGPLEFVIDEVSPGSMAFAELARRVSERFGTELEQGETFLAALIREQIIICLPQIAVTGHDVVAEFLAKLAALPAALSPAGPVLRAAEALGGVGRSPIRNMQAYEEVASELKQAGMALDASRTVQIDLHKRHGEAPTLSGSLVDEVLSQLWSVRALLVERKRTGLDKFASAFSDRYGDASVPLLEALDDDFGVGFGRSSRPPAPIVDGLSELVESEADVHLKPVDLVLIEKLEDALAKGSQEIVLSDTDLGRVTDGLSDLPTSFTLTGSISAADAIGLGSGAYTFEFNAISGVPACGPFGRFCCGDPELDGLVRMFVAETEGDTENVIVAELAHMPGGRMGNVMIRPVLRDHEIIYLGHSGAPSAAQIPATDLHIRCEAGEIILFSQRLGKRIIPRLTNAHSFLHSHGLPIYRFLGLLQMQHEGSGREIWGGLRDRLPFLPAVRYRNLRLARARWCLDATETKAIAKERPEARGVVFRHLASKAIPHQIRLQRGDNFLELNLEEALDQALLIEEARRSDVLVLEDGTSPPSLARDTTGRPLAHELLIPVVRGHPADRCAGRGEHRFANSAFVPKPPGSEWLYAKIFCGYAAMDRLITEIVPELSEFATGIGCEKLFFIRYTENGLHLRLRVCGHRDALWTQLRPRIENAIAPLMATREVSRLEYATYFPEYVRYGGDAGMELCERIFAADSRACSDALRAILQGSAPENERWKLALASIFALLKVFGFESRREAAIAEGMLDSYHKEFNISKAGRDALNDKYRTHRIAIDQIVGGQECLPVGADAALRERSKSIASSILSLKALPVGTALDTIVASLLHMTANRILQDRARLQEMALLHFITKSTASLRARQVFASKMQDV